MRHAARHTLRIFQLKLIGLVLDRFHSRLETCLHIFVVKVVIQTIGTHYDEVFARSDLMLIVKSLVGQLTVSAALVREIKSILLLL